MVKQPVYLFNVQKTLDKEEDLETEVNLSDRFQVGRVGDHLMGIPFECNLCHFRNTSGEGGQHTKQKWKTKQDSCNTNNPNDENRSPQSQVLINSWLT